MNAPGLPESALGLLTIAMIIGSLSVWIGMARRLEMREAPIPLRFQRHRPRVPVFAVVLTLTYIFISVLSVLKRPDVSASISVKSLGLILLDDVVCIAILLLTLFLGARSMAEIVRLGFHTDQLGSQFRDGVLGFLASVVPVGAVLVLTSSIRSVETEHPFLKLLKEPENGGVIALIVLIAVFLAPLKEELMFRVVLQTWLEEFCPRWVAVLSSSLIFSAVHGMPDSLALIPLAIVLGVLYQRRSSYVSIVTVHALFNAYNIFATLVSTQAG